MAFTTTFKTLYENYATNVDASYGYIVLAGPACELARDNVVNIVSTDEIISGGEDGYEIELALLSTINGVTVELSDSGNSTVFLPAVRSINNLVISKSESTSTVASTKLDDFVNSLSWSCVPAYWCTLSSNAGYNIGAWNCCVS
jgi:hypothetical protein